MVCTELQAHGGTPGGTRDTRQPHLSNPPPPLTSAANQLFAHVGEGNILDNVAKHMQEVFNPSEREREEQSDRGSVNLNVITLVFRGL